MPKFNDPALKQQIQDVEKQIEDAPEGTDTSALEAKLEDLEAQQKAARTANRDAWKASKGQGKP